MEQNSVQNKIANIIDAYRGRDESLIELAAAGQSLLNYSAAMQNYSFVEKAFKGYFENEFYYGDLMRQKNAAVTDALDKAVKGIECFNEKAIQVGLEPLMTDMNAHLIDMCNDFAYDVIQQHRETEIEKEEAIKNASLKDIYRYTSDVPTAEAVKETLVAQSNERQGIPYTVVNLQSRFPLNDGQKEAMVGKENIGKINEVLYPGFVKSADDVVKFAKENHADAVIGNMPPNIQRDIINAMKSDPEVNHIPYLVSKTVDRSEAYRNGTEYHAQGVYQIDSIAYETSEYKPGEETKTCAWVSRHSPEPEQLEALGPKVALDGEPIDVTLKTAADMEYLRKRVEKSDMLMVVCPPDKLQDIAKIADGRPLLRSNMVPVGKDENGRNIMKFKSYEQIDKLEVHEHNVQGKLLAERTEHYMDVAQQECSAGRDDDGALIVDEAALVDYFNEHPQEKAEIAQYSNDVATQTLAGIEPVVTEDFSHENEANRDENYISEPEDIGKDEEVL